ncbi:hypothetical protein G6M89_11270 [Natronolimnobius sp. AArcel1]|uniref:hypothetical protein n=1 Tax=Natronolimnobius sp. AArcel1 TaxID=1679093 RepID=UPI0013EA9FB4|nr:hypothetical protein [Natronolimnobius sp. AArcel1]NGM69577.1 hypothetical protein [Natronolimnobius sp. AArcel1]
MNRRQVLQAGSCTALAAGAGCLGPIYDFRYRVTGSLSRHVTISSVDTVPDDFPFKYAVDVIAPEITSTQYARLEIETTNRSESTTDTAAPIYKTASATAGTAGILLYDIRAPDAPSTETEPTCSTSENLNWTLEHQGPTTLEPGESMHTEYVIADDPSVRGCFPVGEYQFDGIVSYNDGTDRTIEWELSIQLEDA